MKNLQHCIILLSASLLAACTDEPENIEREVDFCLRTVWHNGLAAPSAPHVAKTSRALTATDILSAGTDDIIIDTDDYPTTIDVTCKKGTSDILNFTLTKADICSYHSDYWRYTPSFSFRDQLICREDYDFFFQAVTDDDGDPDTDDGDYLTGTADKTNIDAESTHMLIDLHHTKALLRFAFKVSEKYYKVRFIKVKAIRLNGIDCYVKENVLNTATNQLISYAYIDPTVVTKTFLNNIECTYDIYDKDADATQLVKPESELTSAERTSLAAHRTRKDVTARNTFRLNTLTDATSNPVAQIQPGYYYDLRVTLNPDYLYVLAEHDDKHMVIEAGSIN